MARLKHFNDPLSKRSCTDVCCLLIFICFLGGWAFTGYYAFVHGDLDRVAFTRDSDGRACGIDSLVIDRPYLFFFDLRICTDILTPIVGCRTPQVCIDKCPTTEFTFDMNKCNKSFDGTFAKLICRMSVDRQQIHNCDDIEAQIAGNNCSEWYSESESVSRRCLSDVPAFNAEKCTNARYSQQIQSQPSIRNATSTFGTPSTTNALALPLTQRDTRLQNSVAKFRNAYSLWIRFLNNFLLQITEPAVAQEIIADIRETWTYMLVAFFLATISCMVLISIMRWIVDLLVWTSLLGALTSLVLGGVLCLLRFQDLEKNPPADADVINVYSWLTRWFDNPKTWLCLSIACATAFAVLFLTICMLRKRIVIATALVKEGSMAVSSIWSTIFFPVLVWVLHVVITVYGVYVALHLLTIGDKVNHIVGMVDEPLCVCTGPAAQYKDGSTCDPLVFKENCKNGVDVCKKAACNLKEFSMSTEAKYYQAYNAFGLFWAWFFISAFGEMVLAITFSTWYWSFDKRHMSCCPLCVGLQRAVRFHLGTVAIGSLLVTIGTIIRLAIEFIDQRCRKWDNEITHYIMSCMKVFTWCLDTYFRFISKSAYIMCAMHSTSFCTSARDSFYLTMRNVLRVVSLGSVTWLLFVTIKILLTVGMGTITYLVFDSKVLSTRLNHIAVPVSIVAFGTYLIANVFFKVFSMAIDTLFFCFLEDCERNDGSTQRPYFMSRNLMRILKKKKPFVPRQYDSDTF